MNVIHDIPTTIDLVDFDPNTERYQAIEVLEFSTDEMASAVLIDEFVLNGNFKTIDINVLDSDAPIKAQLEKPDKTTWIVRLPRPLPLKRIYVQEFTIGRMDVAEALIEAGYFNYVLSEFQQSIGAAVVVKGTAERVRAKAVEDFSRGIKWKIEAGQLDIYPVVGDKVMDQSIATLANNAALSDLILKDFAIRARDTTGHSSNFLLTAQHSISVYVHSQPQGLNIGIVPVTNDGPMLDEMTGLSGFNLPSNQEVVPLQDNSSIWKAGLQRFLDANFTTSEFAGTFKVGLVLGSENPCCFEKGMINCDYRLLFRDLKMFPGLDSSNSDLSLEQKEIFDGTRWQNYYYDLTLPANSLLKSAVMSFRYTLNRNAFSFVGEPPSEQWLAMAKGVELTSEQWTGGIFQLATAQAVHYLLLPLMATTADTVCALEIREDINGVPSGAIITQQSLNLAQAGKRAWMVVPLAEPLALFSKKLWWLVKTVQGRAVQLVSNNPQGAGITHFNLSDSGGPGAVFRFTRELAVSPVFAKDNNKDEKLHAYLADGDDWQAVGSSSESVGKLRQFDLLPLLPDTVSSSNSDILLRLASLQKGKVVLYPAEITYELEDK